MNKRPIFFISLIFLLLFLFNLSLANDNARTPNTSGAAGCMAILLFIICYSNRRNGIGGWYLYYIIQLYIGIIFSLFMTMAAIENYNPANYENLGYYILFLITTIPVDIFLFAQGVITFKMILKSGREWKYVIIMRYILLADLIFSVLVLILDLLVWPENAPFDIIALIWPIIWLPYFLRSIRIKAVFKTKTWGDEIPDLKNQDSSDGGISPNDS